jgi:hypothetical protein
MRAAIIAVYSFMVCEILFGIGTIFSITSLGQRNPADLHVWDDIVISENGDLVMGLVALAFMIAFAFAAFSSLRWIHRLNANGHLLSDEVRISPRWNVGWFFVPLANLFKPFEGLAQTWRASQVWKTDAASDVPTVMRWWWGFWLVYTIVSNVAFRLEIRAETVGDQLTVECMNLFTSIVAVPLSLTFVSVIRRLTEAQASARNIQSFT